MEIKSSLISTGEQAHPASWISLPQTLTAPLPLYLKRAAAYSFEHLPEAGSIFNSTLSAMTASWPNYRSLLDVQNLTVSFGMAKLKSAQPTISFESVGWARLRQPSDV